MNLVLPSAQVHHVPRGSRKRVSGVAWWGMGAPKKLADPKIKARYAEVGGSTVIVSAAEANAFVREQTERWAKLIKEAGIKAE